ncbi:enoyl-CoA hydratase/isomerase family protein [Ornithinimicrobium sp. F0845]|uniref:enoyl-CoA hydratase/isomerase family protein n=1 Tax=Ornithinimicrobium sp. F0845 TaxID=2926412 RepID=UPI001FF650CA|nr:enoyl-CoA hydratase/isomerase family protein [Ornithinimicrobium sp. F0845]MCK0114222.1 enoyl-CoA hydratase/isomerase family protein [Ornithinimicrobium sp. F0845]
MTDLDDRVLLRVDQEVATLTLSRPGKHNSLTRRMWRQLTEHLTGLADDPHVRIVVVRGEGTTFSSGADLPEVIEAAGSDESARAFCQEVAGALVALAASPKVTVALLSHHVSGGGAEIALACDLRIAQDDAQFSVPVARMGLVPDRLTVRRLISLGGPATARAVLLLARRLDAAHCLRVGLVDEVVVAGGLDGALASLREDLSRTVEYSTTHTKALVLREEELAAGDLVEEFVASMVHGGVADHGRAHYSSL